MLRYWCGGSGWCRQGRTFGNGRGVRSRSVEATGRGVAGLKGLQNRSLLGIGLAGF